MDGFSLPKPTVEIKMSQQLPLYPDDLLSVLKDEDLKRFTKKGASGIKTTKQVLARRAKNKQAKASRKKNRK